MKGIITLTTTLLLSLFAFGAQAKDDQGHSLVDLWKQYYNAERNDRPKDMVKALESIKKEAKARKLTWDFYDACEKYVDARSMSNWKERESLEENCLKELEEFGAPVAVFRYRFYRSNLEEMFRYILANKSLLSGSHNEEFYSSASPEAMRTALSNDYEYVLWMLIRNNRSLQSSRSDCENEARACFKGKYPQEAFLDYELKMEPDAFLGKYEGKAACLMVRQDLLKKQFEKLREDKVRDDAAFRSLQADCQKFMKEAKAFSGNEKLIAESCRIPEKLAKALEGKDAGCTIENGVLSVIFRNVPSAHIRVSKGKTVVFDRQIDNPANHFYITDTVRMDLPRIDDGDYEVSCNAGGVKEKTSLYSKRTLSAALRKDSRGMGIFIAEGMSGKPVDNVRIKVFDGEQEILAERSGLHLDGFTYLPEDIVKAITVRDRKNWERSLTAEYTDQEGHLHMTENIHYYGNDYYGNPDENRISFMVLTDRSAFTPDETVNFKAIAYTGHYKYNTVPLGRLFTVKLLDPEYKEVSRIELSTNEFGSIAGAFKLERRKRNGTFTIAIEEGGRRVGSRSIRVDDFVLPTFDLRWDEDQKEYRPGDTVTVSGNIRSYSGHSISSASISYSIEGTASFNGEIVPAADGSFSISFQTDAERQYQHYHINVKAVDATGETLEFGKSVSVQKEPELHEPTEHFFKELDEEGKIALRVVAGKKNTWAAVELFTTGNVLLEKKIISFEPKDGKMAETVIRYDYKKEFPDVVTLKVIYFQDNLSHSYSYTVRRPDDSWKLPIRFTRFLDTTAPGARYTFSVKTEKDVEMAATVFDKSTESIMPNRWQMVAPQLRPAASVNYVTVDAQDACHNSFWDGLYLDVFEEYMEAPTKGYGSRPRAVLMSKSAATMSLNAVEDSAMVVMEEDVMIETAEAESVSEAGYIRENFANTLAWEPFLRSDNDGNVSFSFSTADKLSTYYVQLFVHDRDMRNFTLRREIVVTLPVKIAVVEPQFLYEGDRYVLKATLSSSTSSAVPGTLSVSLMDGKDRNSARIISSTGRKVSVPANGSVDLQFEYKVEDMHDLGILLTFTPDEPGMGADGVFVTLPVMKPVQTITEAHSSLLFANQSKDELIAMLRNEFVNIPGQDADVKEISIRQMLQEAIPERITPRSSNIVDLTEALYAQYLLGRIQKGNSNIELESSLLEKIRECRNSDGGYAWFPGMESSPVITALVLERFAAMEADIPGLDEAVKFLDKSYFSRGPRPLWRSWISMYQYVHVRALYPQVDFSTKGIDAKMLKSFRKAVKIYLVPRKSRGLNGLILEKVRRVKTLEALSTRQGGVSLAQSWGIVLSARSRMQASIAKDMASISQYAEKHRSGGWYFPNAVLPWRGMLESELYAHALLCEMMEAYGYNDIADGIRLWFMVQKETQQWGSDPAFIEALACVAKGSEDLLDTRVIALSGSFTKPFTQVKAAGNGFSIERSFYRDGKLLEDGDELHVGDRITARYSVWNEENRSYVRLSAPRCAAFRPVEQRSGYMFGCYRNVLADRTEYWFETYPEEKTTRSEDFYVTQEGTFQSPAVEIECLYADHYRANDSGKPAVTVK